MLNSNMPLCGIAMKTESLEVLDHFSNTVFMVLYIGCVEGHIAMLILGQNVNVEP